MTQPTPYQYVKLGSNLEFLRGISTVSVMQTTSLAAFPNLMENLPATRYSVPRVVEALKALLAQLEEMDLRQSLLASGPLRAMLKEMEDYLARVKLPQSAHLNDSFAHCLVALSKQLALVLRAELGLTTSPLLPGEG